MFRIELTYENAPKKCEAKISAAVLAQNIDQDKE
jgi:hypothetical protein